MKIAVLISILCLISVKAMAQNKLSASTVSWEYKKALQLMPRLDFKLMIDSIEVKDYKGSNKVRVELVACNSRECFSSNEHLKSTKWGTSPIYKFLDSSHGVITPMGSALDFCTWGKSSPSEIIKVLTKAIEEGESDENYSIGFQLVEYNVLFSNEIISRKLWSLSGLKDLSFSDGRSFILKDSMNTIKLSARVLQE